MKVKLKIEFRSKPDRRVSLFREWCPYWRTYDTEKKRQQALKALQRDELFEFRKTS